ncbi:MAG: EamA family transporter [Dehalococcoidia bacterium]|nr:MAG: hypothetical protein EVA32_00240 [Chloroflexota bacterium]|tara:strand:+ start:28335 stop:29174 length:840 start_codon:yes stop_codon:yes gene_type:complete
MPAIIIITVLISTLLHATWNFLIKKSNHPYEYVQLLALVSGAISLPFAIFFIITDTFTITGILLSILSGFVHVFYFYFLGTAYKKADLSFVYPIARGTAVALVPLVGLFIIKESVSSISLLGVFIVFLGIFSLGNITHIKSVNFNDLFLSLITGITVTTYTIVDKYAVSLINPFFVFSISSFLGGFLSITLIDRRINHFYLVAKYNIKIVILISFLSAIAYTLILYAYKYSDVSLVTPLREMQTAIAAIMGIVLLNEKLKFYKIIGISFIVIGAILITY